jgi:hypothetical protein
MAAFMPASKVLRCSSQAFFWAFWAFLAETAPEPEACTETELSEPWTLAFRWPLALPLIQGMEMASIGTRAMEAITEAVIVGGLGNKNRDCSLRQGVMRMLTENICFHSKNVV